MRIRAKLARALGLPRTTSYHQPKLKSDDALLADIKQVMINNPAYGHKRIAMELKVGKNRIKRVMKANGLKPKLLRKTWKAVNSPAKDEPKRVNLIAEIKAESPGHIWVSDFTYLLFQGKWYYLATVVDIYTRRIVGWQLGARHTAILIHQAVCEALSRELPPAYFHSDQGSEYTAEATIRLLESAGAEVSFSDKGSPWQNGFQESLYQNFKLELGNLNRYQDLSELYEAIAMQVYYYNHKRIHTALKTSPMNYYQQYLKTESPRPSVEKVGT